MDDKHEIERKILDLQREYTNQLPLRIEEIKTLWRELKAGDDAVLPHILRQAHRLGGSGATFGFPGVTELARQLEALLEGQQDKEMTLPVSHIEAILADLNCQLPPSERR